MPINQDLRHIYVNQDPYTADGILGVWVELQYQLYYYWTDTESGMDYFDTPFGTFRRYISYSVHSPYGFEPVSWG